MTVQNQVCDSWLAWNGTWCHLWPPSRPPAQMKAPMLVSLPGHMEAPFLVMILKCSTSADDKCCATATQWKTAINEPWQKRYLEENCVFWGQGHSILRYTVPIHVEHADRDGIVCVHNVLPSHVPLQRREGILGQLLRVDRCYQHPRVTRNLQAVTL